MKSLGYKIRFVIKEIVFWILMLMLFVLSIYYLDTNPNISSWLTILLGIILFGVLLTIHLILYYNLHNPLCTYEADGKLLDSGLRVIGETPSYEGSSAYANFVIVEYEYRSKKYRKSMVIMNDKVFERGRKLKIKICKFFPRMINIIDKNL